MADRPLNVLFLCTGNTARSILAESILRKLGGNRFQAFSAGSQPKGVVNPFALRVLAAHDCPTDGLRPKSWEEFSGPGAPQIDFVITVCDNAANESCPLWPGGPIAGHWGIADPASVEGTVTDMERAFDQAFQFVWRRIEDFVSLPLADLDAAGIQREMRRIGRLGDSTRSDRER